jgi:hypothetical protein
MGIGQIGIGQTHDGYFVILAVLPTILESLYL